MLDRLTPEQEAQLRPHAEKWIKWGLHTGPLEESDWLKVEDGIRRCYGYANIPWHGNVVRVPSPLVGALSAPLSQLILDLLRNGSKTIALKGGRNAANRVIEEAVRAAVRDVASDTLIENVQNAVIATVTGAGETNLDRLVGLHAEIVHQAPRQIRELWTRRIGGRSWAAWLAYNAFFRDVVRLELEGDAWDRSRALEDARGADWWWPFRDFTIVSDLPLEIHRERVGPDGWGSHRLHREDGPAIRWSDGWSVYSWHGTVVPEWVIMNPTVERAMAESNSEIRRCAMESVGWDKLTPHLGEPLDVAKDPGNGNKELRLYSLPDGINPYPQPVNLLLQVNGSPDRNGSLRTYGETVPATISNAIAAAAWQYGVPLKVYQQLERRT